MAGRFHCLSRENIADLAHLSLLSIDSCRRELGSGPSQFQAPKKINKSVSSEQKLFKFKFSHPNCEIIWCRVNDSVWRQRLRDVLHCEAIDMNHVVQFDDKIAREALEGPTFARLY